MLSLNRLASYGIAILIVDQIRSVFFGVLWLFFSRVIKWLRWSVGAERKTSERFRLPVDGVKDYAIFMLNAKGRVVNWNHGAERITGYLANEIIGRDFSVFYTPEDIENGKPQRALEIAAAEGLYEESGWQARRDGSRYWTSGVIAAKYDDRERLRGFTVITRDESERKRMEEETRFFDSLNQTVYQLAAPEEIMAVASRMLGEYLGVDRCAYAEIESNEKHLRVKSEHTRGDIPSIVGRFSVGDLGPLALRAMRTDRPFVVNDVEAEAPAGSEISAYRRAKIRALICIPLKKNGHYEAMAVVSQKTPRQWQPREIELASKVANRCWESVQLARAVKSLRESDERYRAFIANSSEAIWRIELEQPIPVNLSEEEQIEMMFKYAYLAECNDAMARMYGYKTADQIVGARISDLIVRSDPRNIDQIRAFRRAGYNITDSESSEVDRYGNTKYFLNNLIGILENGAVVRAWGTQRDITTLKRVEEAARESEERLRRILEATQDSIWEIDLKTNRLWWSERAKPLFWRPFGDRPPDLKDWYDRIHPDDVERVMDRFEKFLRNEESVWSDEYRFRRADGSYVYIFDQGRKFYDDSGTPILIAGAMTDITERKLAEEALSESEEQARRQLSYVEAIYATAPVGLCFLDSNLRFLRINDVLAGVGGKSVEEHLGRTLREVVPEVSDAVESDLRRVIETGEPALNVEQRIVMSTQPGVVRHFISSFFPIKNGGGRVLGVNVVVMEITRRKKIEEELERLLRQEKAAREEAQEANRLKDEFLATISHELRTPLTSILGWTRLLAGGRLTTPQARHALEVIAQSAQSQTQLIEDILDTSRIITGRFKIEAQPVAIEHIFHSAIDVIRPSAEAKGIALREVVDAPDGVVLGDANRLQQAVWNLLSNAVKFTSEGGRVEARLGRAEGQIEIEVKDTGIGIEPKFLPYVFDQFRQANSTSTREHGGLGIGLAIVRHIVEMHGGGVSASSPGMDRGATFRIRLPMISTPRPEGPDAEPAPAPAIEPKILDENHRLDGVRVLLVEDDSETLDMLKFIFQKSGAEVIAATSVDEALDALDRFKPDALVSDIWTPDRDGYALIYEVRSRESERGGKIPAVAVTASAGAEDRVRVLLAGFQMHVAKPIDPNDLIAVVASLTGRVYC
ncbi:MAG TPA: PAS domain S-box protein [Blastocatellia bacterium]|nr:PAS domain S-box protein [Blastocatellia bacterium]